MLHLFALGAFAVAQPLFERMSGHVPYLIDQGVTRSALLWLALIVLLSVPAALALCELLLHVLRPRWRPLTHVAFVGLLSVAAALPVGRQFAEQQWLLYSGVAGYVALGLGLGLGLTLVRLYCRTRWLPRLVSVSAIAIVVFPAWFLLASPAATVLSPTPLLSTARAGNPIPVVLVVFDEFSGTSLLNERREIDPMRYPNFARLAATANWYRNATTVHPRTGNALPALLTGTMPHGVNRPAIEAEYPHNLFRILHDSRQYEFVIFESVGRLAPLNLLQAPPDHPDPPLARALNVLPTLWPVYVHAIVPAGLPVDLPRIPAKWFGLGPADERDDDRPRGLFYNPWAEQRDVQCRRFLDRLQDLGQPGLYFCHLCLPHCPWSYLPSGRRYLDDRDARLPVGGSGLHNETWTNDELAVQRSWQRYLLQVGYADRFVGQLLDRLEQAGLFDRCLLIVTADHGVSFQPGHSRRSPDGPNLADILSVPLFVKYPQQRAGRVTDRNVETIDVLPTIADILQLDLDDPTDGASFLDEDLPARQRKTIVNDDGQLILVDAAFHAKYDSLQRMLAAFGSGTHNDRLWRWGPHAELIGRQLADVTVHAPSGITLEWRGGERRVSPDRPDLVPCCLEGRVLDFGSRAAPLTIAVAVNGTIAATTRTSLDPTIRDAWSVMAQESLFQTGDNEIQVLAVSMDGGSLVLEPCRLVVRDHD